MLVFRKHFELAQKYNKPMYFTCGGNSIFDFYHIVKKNREKFENGVVHYVGSSKKLQKFIELDLYVSVNGCSLKTQDHLKAAMMIPLNRLLLETGSLYPSFQII